MTVTKTSGACIAFRPPVPKQTPLATGRSGTAGNRISPAFLDKASRDMLTRFGEQFQVAGIGYSPDGSNELKVFDEFLANHVRPNRICSVQCMLLWSEWVRMFRRRISGFPKLIGEEEFRNVITDAFGVEIANDGYRGRVYPGIKFV